MDERLPPLGPVGTYLDERIPPLGLVGTYVDERLPPLGPVHIAMRGSIRTGRYTSC